MTETQTCAAPVAADALETLEAAAFAASALAPFFMNDPRTGDAADAFAALAELDVAAAAEEWPFVDADEAARDLGAMVEGLAAGADHDDPHGPGEGCFSFHRMLRKLQRLPRLRRPHHGVRCGRKDGC